MQRQKQLSEILEKMNSELISETEKFYDKMMEISEGYQVQLNFTLFHFNDKICFQNLLTIYLLLEFNSSQARGLQIANPS